jgi:hypothetical protein
VRYWPRFWAPTSGGSSTPEFAKLGGRTNDLPAFGYDNRHRGMPRVFGVGVY